MFMRFLVAELPHTRLCVCVCVCMYVCACVCVCVRFLVAELRYKSYIYIYIYIHAYIHTYKQAYRHTGMHMRFLSLNFLTRFGVRVHERFVKCHIRAYTHVSYMHGSCLPCTYIQASYICMHALFVLLRTFTKRAHTCMVRKCHIHTLFLHTYMFPICSPI